MGRAREVKAALQRPRSRKFVIDTESGAISEEQPETTVTTEPTPAPVTQAAHYTYD